MDCIERKIFLRIRFDEDPDPNLKFEVDTELSRNLDVMRIKILLSKYRFKMFNYQMSRKAAENS